jgi:PTS system galactitol-specific IIA component
MSGLKIAIPHTDAEHVNRSALLFARLKEPLEFRSMGDPEEKLQVAMISMFALKEKKLIGDLLETLLTVYQQEAVLEALYHAPDAGSMFRILKENVEKYGK